jgi:sec-independent protein translocase protein TatB
MFDIGWSEMAVILLIALIVIGPRDLPRVARTMGKWVAKGRSMAREFQTAIEDMARETELDKVKSEIEKVSRTNIGKTIEKTIDPSGDLGKAFDPTASNHDAGDSAAKGKDAAPKAKGLPPSAAPEAAATTATKAAATKPAATKPAATKPAATEPAATEPAAVPPKAEAPPAAAGTNAPEREAAAAEAR